MNTKNLYFPVVFLIAAGQLEASKQSTKTPKTAQQKMQKLRKKFDTLKHKPNSKKTDWDAIKAAETENKALKATYKQLEANVLDFAPKVLDKNGVETLKAGLVEQVTGMEQEAKNVSDELVRLQVENDAYKDTNAAMISIMSDLLTQEQLKSGRVSLKEMQEMKQRAQASDSEEEEE